MTTITAIEKSFTQFSTAWFQLKQVGLNVDYFTEQVKSIQQQLNKTVINVFPYPQYENRIVIEFDTPIDDRFKLQYANNYVVLQFMTSDCLAMLKTAYANVTDILHEGQFSFVYATKSGEFAFTSTLDKYLAYQYDILW